MDPYMVVNLLGQLIGPGPASVALRTQYGIPSSVLSAANQGGIWDVTELLSYLN